MEELDFLYKGPNINIHNYAQHKLRATLHFTCLIAPNTDVLFVRFGVELYQGIMAKRSLQISNCYPSYLDHYFSVMKYVT